MFQYKYGKTYDAEIFIRYGIAQSEEDYFEVQDNIFCVADGVTRDISEGAPVPYPKTKEEVEDVKKNYPDPSGALEAAKICVKEFIQAVKQNEVNISQEVLKAAAVRANNAIWSINEGRKINYLTEDYYCCEAVGGIIKDNILYGFALGDCQVTLVDENFNNIFTTENNHSGWNEYEKEVLQKQDPEKYNWKRPEYRAMVRRDYRNKIGQIYQGKNVSFSAMTGEKEVEEYISTYAIPLTNVKYICAYSDGCEPNFASTEEIEKLIHHPDSIKEQGNEKTLVIYEKID